MESTFISQYRQTIQQIEVSATKPWVIDELRELGEKLTTSLERDFEKHPGSTTPYNLLKKALRECLKMEESAFVKTRAYRDGLPLTLDLTEYQGKCSTVKAIYEANGDVVGNLLVLLLDNWQEAEKPEKYLFPIEWNVAKPMLQLVRENARFTVHYQSMQHRLNAAKLNPPQPAASIPVAPSNEPEIVNIEEYLSDKCSLDICDKAAKKIGLSINKSPDTHAYLRIHALTTALRDTRSLQSASIGIAYFRPVLASRYGVTDYNPKYRPQHGKGTGPSRRIEKWDEAYNSAFLVLTNHYEQQRRKK